MKREQRVADFVKALTDIQTAYIEAEHAVETLEVENAKLRELLGSCAILLTDHDFLHWPELLELTLKELHELGIEVEK